MGMSFPMESPRGEDGESMGDWGLHGYDWVDGFGGALCDMLHII
ncbi:hypothetical protein EI77_01116 [Prosthecobacter fusiformis]|uniref:Uncharacterized protein n=1 Tax=Prosthecobacter fusiformis TaxID=48464 RepID=A0A4R7STH7_9BACT|nr:hypothetical protein EI77_01116 [Prosthecobacter fusiformis]